MDIFNDINLNLLWLPPDSAAMPSLTYSLHDISTNTVPTIQTPQTWIDMSSGNYDPRGQSSAGPHRSSYQQEGAGYGQSSSSSYQDLPPPLPRQTEQDPYYRSSTSSSTYPSSSAPRDAYQSSSSRYQSSSGGPSAPYDDRRTSTSQYPSYSQSSLPPSLPPAPSTAYPDNAHDPNSNYYLAHKAVYKNQPTSSIPPPISSSKRKEKKKPRQQFSACAACRQRRVRCDLKDKQEEWDTVYGLGLAGEEPDNATLARVKLQANTLIAGVMRRDDLACTNCKERRMICVDEYAAIKAAKQMRKNKRPGERLGSMPGDVRQGYYDSVRYTTDPYGSSSHSHSRYTSPTRGDSSSYYRQDYRTSGSGYQNPSSSSDPYLGSSGARIHGSAGSEGTGSDRPTSSGQRTQYGNGSGYTAPMQSSSSYQEYDYRSMPAPSSTYVDKPVIAPVSTSYGYVEKSRPPPPVIVPVSAPAAPRSAVNSDAWTASNVGSSNISSIVGGVAPSFATQLSATTPPLPAAPSRPVLPSIVSLSSEPEDLKLKRAEGEWVDLPDLSQSFFESAFYRRFHIQRPIIDPADFTKRYFSTTPPAAKHMGLTGSILCHVIYAWACSYGVDEHGQLDLPERFWPGGTLPEQEGYVWATEQDREVQRMARKTKTDKVVRQILREIDDAGVMRRHSWDGVRCLLLILPLTEFTSTPTERLALYECAVAQVFALCSLSAVNYEGQPLNLGADGDIIRVRLYWYTFVHEGITTGLKGGRLVLEDDDLESFQETLPHGWALVTKPTAHRSFVKFATAPIRLSLACRAIHKALTGSRARRQDRVDKRDMEDAWEALEQCWEEFESIREDPPPSYLKKEDVIRFSDGWKIFMFEAHNVIRESLEHRVSHLMPKPEGAFLRDLSISAEDSDARQSVQQEIYRLHQIARAKCEQLTRQIVDIVKAHIHTTFFEWDASLVRDGTFYAAMSLAKENGSQEDIAICLQALNEMRWAYAKTGERSKKLRDMWTRRTTGATVDAGTGEFAYPGEGTGADGAGSILPSTDSLLQSISGLGPNVGGWFPEGMMADTGSINPSAEDVMGAMDEYDHGALMTQAAENSFMNAQMSTTFPAQGTQATVTPIDDPMSGATPTMDASRTLRPLMYGEQTAVAGDIDRLRSIPAWQNDLPSGDATTVRRLDWANADVTGGPKEASG